MKKSLLTITGLFLLLILNAQSVTTPNPLIKKIYLQVASGGGNHKNSIDEIGIQAILKNNWVATVSYHNMNMRPKNLPADYQPGFSTILFIPISDAYPKINVNLISLTAGRYFKTGRNIWCTAEAGLSVVSGEKMSFTTASHDQSDVDWPLLLFGTTYVPSNYTTSTENSTTIGGMIKADFNWAFSSFAGLGTEVFANLNSLQSPIGFQLKLIIGKMDREKKH